MRLIVVPRPESHTPDNLDPPEVLLKRALELAISPSPFPTRPWRSNKSRTFTRRTGLLVGMKCNLRCHFCAYLDRIDNPGHPEYEFMPLEKAKAICKTLVEVFGRNAVNIEGGEPTIYPHILPLLQYCNEIGLYPTLVTNGIVLDRMSRVLEFKKAGVRDFAVSVHGLGALHDWVVGMEGAQVRQMKGLRNLSEAGIPFRFNTVMTKATILHLPQIATLAVRAGARVVGFMAFAPWADQRHAGVRTANNVPRHSEVRQPLIEALDILVAAGLEANVRFFPLCMLPERHRQSAYNFAQLQYDHHEWDIVSYTWSEQQRTRSGEVTEPASPRPRLKLGQLRRTLQRFIPPRSRLRSALARLQRTLVAVLQLLHLGHALEVDNSDEKEKCAAYADAARTGCKYGGGCLECDARAICDGFHADYADLFGTAEARPIKLGLKLTDPLFYIREQVKIVEPEDEAWAL
jgi:sulfatase maturation enzyme AslB (radical SAM superfamily)